MSRIWFAHKWRIPKVIVALMIIELPLTIANLTLMGIAQPDTYRTKLWQNGFDKGFNSPPNSILYEYANWRTPIIPLVWSSYFTEYNVIISVLSMFLLLAKSAMFVLHAFIPPISVFVHALLVALYSVSIYNQSQPDHSDPQFSSLSMPWYLSKGCSYAEPGNQSYCVQAQGSFAVVIIMTALFATYLGLSIWNCKLTDEERAEREADYLDDLEMKKLSKYDGMEDDMTEEEREELHREMLLSLPKTPKTPGFGAQNPMTPRTTAFNKLSGAPTVTVTGVGPSNALPFRKYGDAPSGS